MFHNVCCLQIIHVYAYHMPLKQIKYNSMNDKRINFSFLPAATGVDTENPKTLVISSWHQFFTSGRVVHVHHCKDDDDKAVLNILHTGYV